MLMHQSNRQETGTEIDEEFDKDLGDEAQDYDSYIDNLVKQEYSPESEKVRGRDNGMKIEEESLKKEQSTAVEPEDFRTGRYEQDAIKVEAGPTGFGVDSSPAAGLLDTSLINAHLEKLLPQIQISENPSLPDFSESMKDTIIKEEN
ncbi:hypothetical protein TWF506_009210 [Arthrobotrys conoides]|uniref:Uncharacterized protein n=1 Tax=Arthrobotrys conoides TaxID=74498 RepID=A0AAN8NM73_9PEZI